MSPEPSRRQPMDLLTDIAADIARYPGTTVAAEDGDILIVSLANGDSYEVGLGEFDEDEDAPFGDEPMSQDYFRPVSITDHVTLLDAILHSIAESPHRRHVTGLTTDGDGSDCEAIFNFDGDPIILKVR